MLGEDVEAILDTSRNYFQPDALGHVYQQVVTYLKSNRTEQRDALNSTFPVVRLNQGRLWDFGWK